jgi:hypothetical protein
VYPLNNSHALTPPFTNRVSPAEPWCGNSAFIPAQMTIVSSGSIMSFAILPMCLLLQALGLQCCPNLSVSVPLLQPNFATKHAIYKNEVAESQAHSQAPPDQPDAQCILTCCGVVDGNVACWIAARRQ